MKINKALITAAGFGTRFLPVTKTIQKEMLPILTKPTIDLLVDDCIRAGITEFIIVVKENDTQISNYYSEDLVLKRYLEGMKKLEKYDQVANLHTKAKFTFVYQRESDLYGTSVPLLLSKELLKDEKAFLVLMGDDFIYNKDGSSEIKRMIETFNSSGAEGLITCVKVPKNLVNKYGIAEYNEVGGIKYLANFAEKPEPANISSDLANLSKYIFTPEIFNCINVNEFDSKSGELYITDALIKLFKYKKVVIHEAIGEYLDTGYCAGWLKANLILAKNNPEIWSELESFVKDLVL